MGLPPSSLIPTLAPVTYRSSRGGQNTKAIYHPFPQATIRDLCKAPKEYGKDSPYFWGLLKADLSGAETLPADLKQLFSCLLNSTEYRLWEEAWKQLLRDALPGLLDNIETMVDGHGNPLTFEHLAEPVQRRSPVLRKFHLLLSILLPASLTAPVSRWLVPQPKANVWATLARAMGQDIYKAIQSIRGMVEDIKKETSDWLSGMFGNWGIWAG
ncbi:hypothetical protein DUI87_01638 [Hirundo rustica rustica]|uniref:Uncharacterized protein n=1 Tax=Hirundo rustica rustica TaxID=333673 RepID=A0A3M0L735_HIRRU|nr:hypothetical protein DUI87_01638 [Hirundo rustica rustica]